MIDVPVLVKDALRSGAFRKNYRFLVLNDDGTTDFIIDNQNLVSESVNIDERMCSGDTIKFGLCEGSSLEFQYFGKDNITGRQIKAFIDVDYGETLPYTIPMGFFTVKNCSRQASTGIIKATAYNKLQSDYLDANANEMLVATYYELARDSFITKVSMDLLLSNALEGYAIESDNTFELEYDGTSLAQPFNKTRTSWSVEQTWWNFYISSTIQFVLPSGVSFPWGYARVRIRGLRDLWQRLTQTLSSINEYPRKVLITSTTVNNYEITLSSSTENDITTDVIENVSTVTFTVPGQYYRSYAEIIDNPPAAQLELAVEAVDEIISDMISNNELEVQYIHVVSGGLGNTIVTSDIENWGDVTLRELQSAVFESQCQFGQLDRTTDLFSGVELNRSRLLPADTLYPSNTLYPNGAQSSANKSMYSKLWADEGNIHKWKYLIITYKAIEDNQEVEKTLQRTVNADGTDNYNMSDNWLFKNLVWTAEDVGTYADAMVAKMQDITWFPFEMWCAGLPYLETGDEIEIPLGEETYTSYVLQRQLKGIQNLQDTYINGTLDIF